MVEANTNTPNLISQWRVGTVPEIGLYEVKVGGLYEASNKKF